MTEKLTYNPTPADAPELTEDEQNSLEVADKLGQEEAKQYAGKFDNADQLEKAYLELQKKRKVQYVLVVNFQVSKQKQKLQKPYPMQGIW